MALVTTRGRVDSLARGTVTITATESGVNPQSISYTVRVLPAVLKGSFIDETSLRSTHTGIDYPYTVYLPAGYAAGTKRYPVIYMTDGQWNTNLYKMADQRGKEFIMVMIYQGPEHRRMTDYLPPGTTAYMRFLKTEMVPLIESTYRTNGDRSFYGVSAGGTIGSVLLANEPVGEPYFKRYILGDGAFFALTPDVLQQESARFAASPALNVSVLLTGTRQGNLVHAQALSDRYKSRAYTGMTIKLTEYPLTHEEMGDPTFIEAMDTYF